MNVLSNTISDGCQTINYNHRTKLPMRTMNSIVVSTASGIYRCLVCWILIVLTNPITSTIAATLFSTPHLPSQASRPQYRQRRKVAIASSNREIIRKRLLAIRVSSLSSGETPKESLLSIQSAIFGSHATSNDTNSEIPSNATSVVEQYQSISHGQLLLEPANTTTTQSSSTSAIEIVGGVFDLYMPNITFAGQLISNLTDFILHETMKQLSSSSLTDVADHIIFCLPDGSSFQNDPNWTAYTYLNQPYSYYQLSRCTCLSVVAHEVCLTPYASYSYRNIQSEYSLTLLPHHLYFIVFLHPART